LTVDNIDVDATVKKVHQLLAAETPLSPALRSALEVLLLVVQLRVNRLGLNSRNSSKPPSSDRYPARANKPQDGANKPGGQPGRIGTTLQKIDDPDEIKILEVDRATLPLGSYRDVGYECRQVFDIDIRRVVTEYRAQILEDQFGQRVTAPFPVTVTKAVQYGNGVKAQAVYLSQYQLKLPISVGSIYTFNQQAHALLEQFEQKLVAKLLQAPVLHADETGINIGGKKPLAALCLDSTVDVVSRPCQTRRRGHDRQERAAPLCRHPLPRPLETVFPAKLPPCALQRPPPTGVDLCRRARPTGMGEADARVVARHPARRASQGSADGQGTAKPETCWNGCGTMRRRPCCSRASYLTLFCEVPAEDGC
jgi:hypothetical protein